MEREPPGKPDHLSRTFAALADPTRRQILAHLSSGERSVLELARPFDVSLPAITKHLKVLERAGLITRRREAQWRPCQLRAQPLRDADDWIEKYRQFWEESFDRLADYLRELRAGPTAHAGPAGHPAHSAHAGHAGPAARGQGKKRQTKRRGRRSL